MQVNKLFRMLLLPLGLLLKLYELGIAGSRDVHNKLRFSNSIVDRNCCNSVEIGEFSTFAGFRSQILTHAIDLKASRQRSAPVLIGDYCFVGTSVVLLAGSQLPSYCVLGASACLTRAFSDENMLYAGVPAKAVKGLYDNDAYFKREKGFVL